MGCRDSKTFPIIVSGPSPLLNLVTAMTLNNVQTTDKHPDNNIMWGHMEKVSSLRSCQNQIVTMCHIHFYHNMLTN